MKLKKVLLIVGIILLVGLLASVVTFAIRPDLKDKINANDKDSVVQTPPVDDKPNEPVVEESKYKYTELGLNNYSSTLYFNATEKQMAGLAVNNGMGDDMPFSALILVEDKYLMALMGGYENYHGSVSQYHYLAPFGERFDYYPEHLKANIMLYYNTNAATNDEYVAAKDALAQEFTNKNGLPTYLPDNLGINANAFGEDMQLISPVNGQKIGGCQISIGQMYFACQPQLFSTTPVLSRDEAMSKDYSRQPLDTYTFYQMVAYRGLIYFDTTRPLEEQMDLTTNRCVLDTSRFIALYVQDGILYAGPSAFYNEFVIRNFGQFDTEEERRAVLEDLALNCCKVIYSMNDTSIQFYGKTVHITKGWQNLDDYGCFNFETLESQYVSDIDGENCNFFWIEENFKKVVSGAPMVFVTAENINAGSTDYNLTFVDLQDRMMVYLLSSKA